MSACMYANNVHEFKNTRTHEFIILYKKHTDTHLCMYIQVQVY